MTRHRSGSGWRRRLRRGLHRALVVLVTQVCAAAGVVGWYASTVELPADPTGPQASTLYYRDGTTVLARVGVADRTDVPLDRVPEHARRAVLAAEDRSFYDHHGVSPRGLARAAWTNVVRSSGQGASTITQQYVRNAFLTQERTASRKAREVVLAVKLERRYGKDEILARYLNTVYFGRGAYGIAAAAQAYFGTDVDRLTLEQAAVLAAVVKDPWNLDPAVGAAAARTRWLWVLDSMAELGWATRQAVAAARYPEIRPRSALPASVPGALGPAVDAIERELAEHGIPPQALHTAGLRVVTTLDANAQAAATDAVARALRGQPTELRAALVAVDPATGGVRAYYGGDSGRGYLDLAATPRPPASTFKPVVLAEGLRQGISMHSLWDGSSPRMFTDRHGVPLSNRDGLRCPACPLDEAMVASLNTPYYALAQKVGPARVRALAIDLGIASTYDGVATLVDQPGDPTPGRPRADLALGRYPVTPADLASVYATFAADGVRTTRHLVDTVTGPDQTWYRDTQRPVRVLSPAVAADVTDVLARVVARTGPIVDRPAAGKTGTQQWADTSDNQDAWMAGYTPQLAAVVWVGRLAPAPIRTTTGTPVRGEGLPAHAWAHFLTSALRGEAAVPLPGPADVGSVHAGDAAVPAPESGRPT